MKQKRRDLARVHWNKRKRRADRLFNNPGLLGIGLLFYLYSGALVTRNLDIDEYDSFYVGELQVWVHNSRHCGGTGAPVKAGDEGTYGELKAQKRKHGETEKLDMDHQPSYAAQVAAKEKKLGRSMNADELKKLKADTPAVAAPERSISKRVPHMVAEIRKRRLQVMRKIWAQLVCETGEYLTKL